MTILDKRRFWAFLTAYLICYVSLVGLYVIIDAFSNLDEFSKRTDSTLEMCQFMIRYYMIHRGRYFDQLYGVVGIVAAIVALGPGALKVKAKHAAMGRHRGEISPALRGGDVIDGDES